MKVYLLYGKDRKEKPFGPSPLPEGRYIIARREIESLGEVRLHGSGIDEEGLPLPTIYGGELEQKTIRSVSRNSAEREGHLEISVGRSSVELTDMSSSGTFLDRQKITQQTITRAGTYQLELGNFPLKLKIE